MTEARIMTDHELYGDLRRYVGCEVPRLWGFVLLRRRQGFQAAATELLALLTEPALTRRQLEAQIQRVAKAVGDWGITAEERPRQGPDQTGRSSRS